VNPVVFHQTFKTVKETDYLNPIFAYGSFGHRPYYRVKTGAITTSGQDADSVVFNRH
jgi:hypothetical protein